ncbi:unnamed protein product [Caenorhabditis sp. 36 PRJEB53466]|nr:unnamed protein product [Caenorhabditis sp. 36 PRJEB53466]
MSSQQSPIRAFVPRYCRAHSTDIVFVRQKDGKYAKYMFDVHSSCFIAFTCLDCHLETTETDLFPQYAVWANALSRYVIFSKNATNGQMEQYVYNAKFAGFEQVHRPELVFDADRIQQSNVFFTVSGPDNTSVTIILRDPRGFFRKEQYNMRTERYEILPISPVKLLPMPTPLAGKMKTPITFGTGSLKVSGFGTKSRNPPPKLHVPPPRPLMETPVTRLNYQKPFEKQTDNSFPDSPKLPLELWVHASAHQTVKGFEKEEIGEKEEENAERIDEIAKLIEGLKSEWEDGSKANVKLYDMRTIEDNSNRQVGKLYDLSKSRVNGQDAEAIRVIASKMGNPSGTGRHRHIDSTSSEGDLIDFEFV